MTILNDTKIPTNYVSMILDSALEAVLALPHWPQPIPPLINCTVRVKNGVNHGVSTQVYEEDVVPILGLKYETEDEESLALGSYIEVIWAIDHRNRNTYHSDAKDRAAGQTPDVENAIEIYLLCAHEFAHCIEALTGFKEDPPFSRRHPSFEKYLRRGEEVRVREYERQVLFNLTPIQWETIKILAKRCEMDGDPNRKRSSFRIPFGSPTFLTNRCRYWVDEEGGEGVPAHDRKNVPPVADRGPGSD